MNSGRAMSLNHIEITIEDFNADKTQKKEKDNFTCKKYIADDNDLGYRKQRRSTGLELPLNPLQVVAWFYLIITAIVSFVLIIPSFTSKLQGPLYIIVTCFYICHIISHLAVLLIDPVDTELRRLHHRKRYIPKFDRAIYQHVVENGRCHLCDIYVSNKRTKHCATCNKCVGKFDHHCDYLNCCIGGRNYIPFLFCVGSGILVNLVVVLGAIALNVYYYLNAEMLSLTGNDSGNIIFLIFIGLVGLLAAVVVGFLMLLFCFHIYICCVGLTTYEFGKLNKDVEASKVKNVEAPIRRKAKIYPQSQIRSVARESENVLLKQPTATDIQKLQVEVEVEVEIKEKSCSQGSNRELSVTLPSASRNTNLPGIYDILENILILGLIAALWRQHWKKVLKNFH